MIPKNGSLDHLDSETAPKRAEHPDVIAVWDLEKDAWRSFSVSSVIRIQVDSVDVLNKLEEEESE